MNKLVYLFPLSNSTLFKKVTLPFHIFEPRYKKMIHDSLSHEIPIAITPYLPSGDYSREICVAGHPQVLSTYPDGRMDIYITGDLKCRLTQCEAFSPYLIYKYDELEENMELDESFIFELDSFKTLLENWAKKFLPDSLQRQTFSHSLNDPELLINYCTVFLVEDSIVKENVMKAKDMGDKMKILMKVLGPKEISLGPFAPLVRF